MPPSPSLSILFAIRARLGIFIFIVAALVLLDAGGGQLIDHPSDEIEPEHVEHLKHNQEASKDVKSYPVTPSQIQWGLIEDTTEDEAREDEDTCHEEYHCKSSEKYICQVFCPSPPISLAHVIEDLSALQEDVRTVM